MRQSNGLVPRQHVSIGSDGVRLPTFSTPSTTHELTHGSPMDSIHSNPSPSDPMESVCQHFPPPHNYTLLYIYLVPRELTRGSPMDSFDGNPSPSDPMESICPHFPPPPQLYFAVFIQSLSQTDFR